MADLLSIGISGLNVSKKALETTGHNLANVNTEGYSRQRVQQTTNIPTSKDGLIQGTGARIVGVGRIHDQHIERRLNTNISKNEYFQERSLQLEQVENIFNEINNDGLNKILNEFYNSFRELSNQPENETIRSVVRDNARLISKDFNRINQTLEELSSNVDKKIIGSIHNINQNIRHISDLNKKIVTLEATNDETGDLRDQRDLAVKNLSKYFTVSSYLDGKNRYVVSAKGVGTLVSGGEYQELDTSTKSKKESSNNMAGSIEIFFKNKSDTPVTSNFKTGSLQSLVHVRNQDLVEARSDIDNIAYNFVNTVNAIHRRGYVNREININSNGSPVQSDEHGPTTGINFFQIIDFKDGAASKVKISELVKENLSNVATAASPNAPGDNRIAIAISKIQHEKILDDSTTTLEEKYLQIIGNIGLESGKATFDKEQSHGILTQTEALREKVSGVSIDEETSNLVKYQHAYEASAKVLKSADEMFKTVLGIMP